MGSSRPRNLARVGGARSSKTVPRRSTNPASPNSFKLRAAREQRAEAILKAAKAANPARATSVDVHQGGDDSQLFPVSPNQALREMRDGVPATALRLIQGGLKIASAATCVCAAALKAQAADSDTDIALVLQRCVLDTLTQQMDRIESLLKEVAP